MNAAEFVEEFRKLPPAEQQDVLAQLWEEEDAQLTPEQVAELDRRAEHALAHPEQCRTWDEVKSDFQNRFTRGQ